MVLTGELIAIRNNTVRAKWGASAFSNGLQGVLQAAPNPQSPMNRIEVRRVKFETVHDITSHTLLTTRSCGLVVVQLQAPMFVPSCLAQVNLDSRASFGTSGRNFPVSIWSGFERELLGTCAPA
jgi:hypothetical protein